MKPRAGLVLTGGGARAAYQVGVVKAVRDILGNPTRNPFPILCGTSAGAINTTTLAVFADNFSRGAFASATASAVMLTMRRTVAEGVRIWTGRPAPSRIGPMVTFSAEATLSRLK